MSRSVILTTLVAVTLAISAACAQEAEGNPFDLEAGTGQAEQPETPETLDQVVEAALSDVQRFWEESYPEVYGEPFEPIAGGFWPYGEGTEQPPCGPEPLDYDEIANNAFYCPSDDLIAWDEDILVPDLADRFGPFTVGIVFAHEFGHAIQFRGESPEELPTIVSEMQADCFAGAWTAWIADGNSDDFAVSEDELDQSVAGMTSISDPVGASFEDPGAHGAGFDRIGSFQDGFEHGADRCAEYDTDAQDGTLPIVEIPFSTDEEEATSGNLHLEDQGADNPGLFTLAEANLNIFYGELFEELGQEWQPVDDLVLVDPETDEISCDGETVSGDELEYVTGYCQDENVVVLDGQGLVNDLYDEIGDFAVGAEMARLWAQAAQLQLDVDLDDLKIASLQADCLTGVWAQANFPRPPDYQSTSLQAAVDDPEQLGVRISLSPGDLDEAVQGFLAFGQTGNSDTGTVFERTAALRAGFVEGVESCEDYLSFS